MPEAIERGFAYTLLRKFEKALSDYDRGIQLDPKDARAYSLRGLVDWKYSRIIRRLSLIMIVLFNLILTHLENYKQRGITYYMLEKADKALTDYAHVIQLDLNDAEIYYMRGNVYSGILEDYQKALADYDRVIQLDPMHAKAHFKRGYIYFQLEQYEKAFADLDRAIQLDPTHTRAYHMRGLFYLQLNQYEKALDDLDRTIQDDPENDNVYDMRGSAYIGLKQYEKALADFEHAIELNPSNTEAQKGRELASRWFKGQ